MLRGMRKASSNWLGKIIMSVVMGVLIVSFGIWGIADMFKGFGQSTLAKIGHTEISTEQFRQVYTDRLQQIGRQFGRPLTSDQARAFGLDRQVLQQMVAEAALDEDARRLGLGQSEEAVKKMILDDPNFKNPNGAFDPVRFTQTLRQYGFTEQRYVAEQRRVSLRRQIANTVSAGLEPPKVMLEAANRFANEQRTIEYVKLDAAQAGNIDPPSPEALASYFDDHKTQFRAPEYRKISFVVVTAGRDRQMVEHFRRGREEGVRAAARQIRNAGAPRDLANRVPQCRRGPGDTHQDRCRNVVRRTRQGTRPHRRRRQSRHGREIRHYRSDRRERGVFAQAGRSQPACPGQVRRRFGEGRQDRARR